MKEEEGEKRRGKGRGKGQRVERKERDILCPPCKNSRRRPS